MTEAENLFYSIGDAIENVEKGKLFGKPCYKTKGKAFVCFFENEMVFKLSGDDHSAALALSESQLFDPSKKNRPMKEWVQVPFQHQEKWSIFTEEALKYVNSLLKA